MDDPTLHEDHWRWRLDDGGEEETTGATWHELEDVAHEFVSAGLDVPVRPRFSLHGEVSNKNNLNVGLQYSINGGTWLPVNATSIVARSVASGNFTDGDDTTEHGVTYAGTGAFIGTNKGMEQVDGIIGAVSYSAQDFASVEFCIELREADLNDTDSIEFRLVEFDTPPVVFDSYPATHATATISLASPFDEFGFELANYPDRLTGAVRSYQGWQVGGFQPPAPPPFDPTLFGFTLTTHPERLRAAERPRLGWQVGGFDPAPPAFTVYPDALRRPPRTSLGWQIDGFEPTPPPPFDPTLFGFTLATYQDRTNPPATRAGWIVSDIEDPGPPQSFTVYPESLRRPTQPRVGWQVDGFQLAAPAPFDPTLFGFGLAVYPEALRGRRQVAGWHVDGFEEFAGDLFGFDLANPPQRPTPKRRPSLGWQVAGFEPVAAPPFDPTLFGFGLSTYPDRLRPRTRPSVGWQVDGFEVLAVPPIDPDLFGFNLAVYPERLTARLRPRLGWVVDGDQIIVIPPLDPDLFGFTLVVHPERLQAKVRPSLGWQMGGFEPVIAATTTFLPHRQIAGVHPRVHYERRRHDYTERLTVQGPG